MSHHQNCIYSFVNQLIERGLQHVIICPGSRNAPLIQAFLKHDIQHFSVIDERSAGFVALGMAQKLQQPVGVICTSGTAAANLIPAAIEAYYSGIPLLLLTADRPQELIDQWDGQCIRQNGLFANHIAGEYTTPDTYLDPLQFRIIADNAYSTCFHPDGGPVHVNIPIKEPLYEEINEIPEPIKHAQNQQLKSDDEDLKSLKKLIDNNRNILVLNGANFEFLSKNEALESPLPILSDIISNRKQFENVRGWDAMISCKPKDVESLKPNLLITTGRSNISKSLKQFLQANPPDFHVHLSLFELIGDPFKTKPTRLKILEGDFLTLLKHVEKEDNYLKQWQGFSNRFGQQRELLESGDWNELQAVQKILEKLPSTSTLHLGNSMPVRYASLVSERTDLTCYGNRGTSGIDGSTSTSVGASLVSTEINTLLTGDISFFYDLNGLWNNQLPPNLNIVVLNNGGGQIFNLLEGPEKIPESLPYQTTVHERSVKMAASEFGLKYLCADNFIDLEQCLDELNNVEKATVLEIKTNPESNKAFYRRFKNIEI
jgi:2-succinyl-5-enolpyruvyl-6-hydroxy-3-cyclohexene-1-carboxylate synthase